MSNQEIIALMPSSLPSSFSWSSSPSSCLASSIHSCLPCMPQHIAHRIRPSLPVLLLCSTLFCRRFSCLFLLSCRSCCCARGSKQAANLQDGCPIMDHRRPCWLEVGWQWYRMSCASVQGRRCRGLLFVCIRRGWRVLQRTHRCSNVLAPL